MELNNSIQDKIRNVYNKKNYKNIERFSTIHLEGFNGKPQAKPKGPSFTDYLNATGKIITGKKQDINLDTDQILSNIVDDKTIEKIDEFKEGVSEFKGLMTDQYKAASDTLKNTFDKISNANLPGMVTGLDVDKVKDIISSLKGGNKGGFVEEIKKGLQIVNNIIVFPICFINNLLIYISIVITQLSYGVSPIWPFGNLFHDLSIPNWPWKLDLDVSPNDNLASNPDAQLYDPSGASVPVADGNVPAEIYYENQKILFDSNIIYNIFTQIILIGVTWVITNNVYYYAFEFKSDKNAFPFRIMAPVQQSDDSFKVKVERGFGAIFYTIINTLFCTPYDIFTKTLTQFRIIEVSKSSPFYGFRELSYICFYLVILYFVLTYFWNIFNSLINDFFSYNVEPFYFIFVIYGLIMHYWLIEIVEVLPENKFEVVKAHWYIKKGLSIMLIMSVFTALYPLIRIMVFVWSIYIFFGLQGFGNDTYDDITKLRMQDDCGSNKFSIFKFIKNVIVLLFPYFIMFVLFVLLIYNLNNLNLQPTFNSDSSSGMKIILAFFLFLYLCILSFLY